MSGLAAGEAVTVRVLGKTKRGHADRKAGVFTGIGPKVTGKPGTVEGDRRSASSATAPGTTTFKVVR